MLYRIAPFGPLAFAVTFFSVVFYIGYAFNFRLDQNDIWIGPSLAQAATQQAVLTWTDVANEDSYVIERKVGPTGTYAQVGTTAMNVVTFIDPALAGGTNFCWHVFGKNAVGSAVPSDDVCMGTIGVPNKTVLGVTIQIVP